MPTISIFYGIVIAMYFDDHNPPHFHVRYANARAVVSISDLTVIEGALPIRAERLVREWAAQHRPELMENWDLCATMTHPNKIAPLT